MTSSQEVRNWLSTLELHRRLRTLALKLTKNETTAEDIFQDTLTRALGKTDRLAELPDWGKRYSYLARTMDRRVAELMGRKARHISLPSEDTMARPSIPPGRDDTAQPGGYLEAVPALVSQLDEDDQAFVRRYYYEGQSKAALGRAYNPALRAPASQVREAERRRKDALLHARFGAFADPRFAAAFADISDGEEQFWRVYYPEPEAEKPHASLAAMLEEETARADEQLLMRSVTSTAIPPRVQQGRVRRIAAARPAECEKLRKPLADILSISVERNACFRWRLRHCFVRHIACLETVQEMLRGGWCSNDQVLDRFGEPAYLRADEARETVEEIVRLLRTPQLDYQLGLIPKGDDMAFRAYWKVLDGTVLLETWQQAPGHETDVVIRQKKVAGDFGDYFARQWRKIPSELKDRKQVARLLASLLA